MNLVQNQEKNRMNCKIFRHERKIFRHDIKNLIISMVCGVKKIDTTQKAMSKNFTPQT